MTNVSVKVKRKPSLIKGKQMPLFLQVICNREVKRIVLDLKLSSDEWLQDNETVVIPAATNTHRITELLQIRQSLEHKLEDINKVVQFLVDKQECTAERIVNGFLQYKRYTCWLAYIQLVIEEKQQANRSEATLRNYRSTYNAFRDFLGNEDIPVSEVDENMIRRFEQFLLNKKNKPNTIAFHCRNLKSVWNRAVRDHVIDQQPSPFRNISTGIGKTEKRTLSEKSFKKLENLKVEDKRLTLALDIFLFCFYARGMAFVDLAHLTEANIRGNYIIYVRRKTGQQLKIELLPMMLAILKKYHKPGRHYLFPVLNNINASFREYDSALRLQNKRLTKLGKLIGCHLSTYVARHTWASFAKQRGIDEDTISEGMGHTSIGTTRIYIATLDNSKIDKANRIVIFGKQYKKMNGYRETESIKNNSVYL